MAIREHIKQRVARLKFCNSLQENFCRRWEVTQDELPVFLCNVRTQILQNCLLNFPKSCLVHLDFIVTGCCWGISLAFSCGQLDLQADWSLISDQRILSFNTRSPRSEIKALVMPCVSAWSKKSGVTLFLGPIRSCQIGSHGPAHLRHLLCRIYLSNVCLLHHT